jgi:hypothetical protein
MNNDVYEAFFRPRAIDRATANNKDRYVLVDRAEEAWRERLEDLHSEFAARPKTAVRRVGKTWAIVIRKFAVPTADGAPIVPQFRADEPHAGPLESHDHAELKPGTRRFHVDGKYHEGLDVEGEHEFRRSDGKYMMWPAPRKLERVKLNHLRYRTVDSLVEHLLEEHDRDAELPQAEEDHFHEREVKDRDVEPPEKRLDMHPRSLNRMLHRHLREQQDRVFFVIEGAVKADALMDAGEVSFDVPSVTLWDSPDLEPFAREYLRGVPTYITPDSDWASNPQVATQAFAAKLALERYGAIAYVAAPTPSRSSKLCAHGRPRRSCKEHRKRGVDDFLGDGRRVDDMTVLARTPSAEFETWSWRRLNVDPGDLRERKADSLILRWMTLHAADDGAVALSARQVMRYTVGAEVKTVKSRRRRETIQVESAGRVNRAVRRLLEGGELETLDELRFGARFWFDNRGAAHPSGDDWDRIPDDGKNRLPVFTIRKDLRADSEPVRLGEFAPEL